MIRTGIKKGWIILLIALFVIMLPASFACYGHLKTERRNRLSSEEKLDLVSGTTLEHLAKAGMPEGDPEALSITGGIFNLALAANVGEGTGSARYIRGSFGYKSYRNIKLEGVLDEDCLYFKLPELWDDVFLYRFREEPKGYLGEELPRSDMDLARGILKELYSLDKGILKELIDLSYLRERILPGSLRDELSYEDGEGYSGWLYFDWDGGDMAAYFRSIGIEPGYRSLLKGSARINNDCIETVMLEDAETDYILEITYPDLINIGEGGNSSENSAIRLTIDSADRKVVDLDADFAVKDPPGFSKETPGAIDIYTLSENDVKKAVDEAKERYIYYY